MIKHIVLWKLDSSYSPADKEEILKIFKAKLLGLKGKVPQIQSLEVYLNSKQADATNYDIMLETGFNTINDLNDYQVHPNHLIVVEYVKTLKRQRTCIDYEY
jgi:hypothetical protein